MIILIMRHHGKKDSKRAGSVGTIFLIQNQWVMCIVDKCRNSKRCVTYKHSDKWQRTHTTLMQLMSLGRET